jgi:hypothetical protein
MTRSEYVTQEDAEPDGGSLFFRYFQALDTGAIDQAISFYSPECVCVRQTAPGDSTATVYSGFEEVAKFLGNRGKKPYRHQIVTSIRRGREHFVEGIIELEALGLGADVIFMLHATVDHEDLIEYLSGITCPISREANAALKVKAAASSSTGHDE